VDECTHCFLQYIINASTDNCQQCPAGLKCHGDATFEVLVPNSTWIEDGAIYRLQGCPSGYYVSPDGPVDANNAMLQKCTPCGKGEECTNSTCITCSMCAPGFYKAAVSAEACLACPANTYRMTSGATELGNCQACPSGADTRMVGGQTRPTACVCGERFYLSGATCSNCPQGALCQGGSKCALNFDQTCPGENTTIIGTWVRATSADQFQLVGCPAGTQTQNASHDTYKCHPCLDESQYIIDPDTNAWSICVSTLPVLA